MTRTLSYIAALVLFAGLAGCGSSNSASTGSSGTGSAAASTSTPSTGATTPTTTTKTTPPATTTTSGPGAQAAGGPVPSGFDPISFTAISDQEFWLLGSAPCSNPVCTSIVRTTDGGRHFVGIPAPVAPVAGVRGAPQGQGLEDLRFANPLDGFAGGAFYPQALWETHDGGEHWSVGLRNALAFTVSGDRVYAVTGTCSNGTCTSLRLQVSSARADDWHTTPLPSGATEVGLGVTAHGTSVWVWASSSSSYPKPQMLFYSSNAGQTLTHLNSPCTPGLGGDLQASSDRVVWAVCPTGMMAQAWRSADAGVHWQSLPVGLGQHSLPLSNGARLAPVSDTSAVISASALGPLLRTTDAGGAFATIGPSLPREPGWDWIGFTDATTGSALRPAASPSTGPQGLEVLQLWRSYDGGGSWTGPVRIGP